MTRILLLGATGRTAAAVLAALPDTVGVTAALRTPADVKRLADTVASLLPQVVDIADGVSLRRAMDGVDVVVNAIRLREDIDSTALVCLHDRLVTASIATNGDDPPRMVTVGGAGALRLPGGARFWEHPTFPSPTLPRGRAHAALRDHLESGRAGEAWAYLIPPPAYQPHGPARGHWQATAPSTDESVFTTHAISYADFGRAVAAVALGDQTGTRLIAWPR